MTQRFIEWTPTPEDQLNGKLESEARKTWCGFARVITGEDLPDGSTNVHATAAFNRIALEDKKTRLPEACMCVASQCAHWRWLHRGGMVHEKQTFQSEWPQPEGNKAPADVPDGWTFMQWDYNTQKQTPKPRFWASRPTSEVVLPRGVCGLAGDGL